jgi:long-chain fatty acid transport protein
VTLGAACRSRIGLDMDNGQVSFRSIPDSLASQFVQQRYVSSFVLPTQIQAGLSWQPLDWIVVSSDVEYSWWSQITSIVVTYPNSRWLAQTIQAGWRNTVNSRSGLELLFGDVALRAGYRIEDSPIPDRTFLPGIPDAAGTGYTLGFGYRVAEGLVLDFAYMFLRYGDRHVTNSLFAYDGNGDLLNGTYVSKTTAIALNVLYTWK